MRYTYRCWQCGYWDAEHPIGHAPHQQQCPRCGAISLRCYTAFMFCVRRGRTDLDGSHLPETTEEKAYWRERGGVDVDRFQVAVNGFGE